MQIKSVCSWMKVAGVDLKMSVVKPFSVKWLIGVYGRIGSRRQFIVN